MLEDGSWKKEKVEVGWVEWEVSVREEEDEDVRRYRERMSTIRRKEEDLKAAQEEGGEAEGDWWAEYAVWWEDEKARWATEERTSERRREEKEEQMAKMDPVERKRVERRQWRKRMLEGDAGAPRPFWDMLKKEEEEDRKVEEEARRKIVEEEKEKRRMLMVVRKMAEENLRRLEQWQAGEIGVEELPDEERPMLWGMEQEPRNSRAEATARDGGEHQRILKVHQ